MSTFKLINLSPVNILNGHYVLGLRNIKKIFKEQQACLSVKKLEKLGIPPPPKKPINPYLRYVQTVQSQVARDQPHLNHREVIRKVAQDWHAYDAEKKKLLEQQFLAEKQTYRSLIEKYKQSLTPKQYNLIQETQEKEKLSKARAKTIKKKEELGKPKKPLTPYLKYMLEKKKQKNDNQKYSDWLKIVGGEWKNLSQELKEKYQVTYQKELEKYKSDIVVWEESMIRQGHTDVVRNPELLNNKPKKKRNE